MKISPLLLGFFCLCNILSAQKDTIYVQGYYESGGKYGTLNKAIEAEVASGTINNTVFKLTPNEKYILTESIFLDHGQNLEIVAPKPIKAGDSSNVQNSAPPQILWTEKTIARQYIIQTYGDVIMKNIWVRYADILGEKITSSIVFEDQTEENDPEKGNFDGCLFDYAGVGAEAGGAITVKSDHFDGEFINCYWRNNSDNHFRYYGRAVSFPYESIGWHYDRLLFENCSFTNLSRIVMMEKDEYGSNVHLNHCTILNCIEWIIQSGWLENLSITNSLFINPSILGYRAVDICRRDQSYEDFINGECESPGGGLIGGITPVDSFGFDVDFTDFDRKIFIGNNSYVITDWMLDWYTESPWAHQKIMDGYAMEIYNPKPMLGEEIIAFIDSVDELGNKIFTKMNVDNSTMYFVDPDFIVPATNLDTLLLFIHAKWHNSEDYNWAYKPETGFRQTWPLPENLAYNNSELQKAAMGGFPLGDLNWYSEIRKEWELQKDKEWEVINNWLNYGSPNPTNIKNNNVIVPEAYLLNQNHPNPFNPSTVIKYQIPLDVKRETIPNGKQANNVKLVVFDILGREVITLVNEKQKPGNYEVKFDAANLTSGIYFYRIVSGNFYDTKKMILLK